MTEHNIREAILQAAANLGNNGKGQDGIIGWLELMRVRHPEIFKLIMARVQQKDPSS